MINKFKLILSLIAWQGRKKAIVLLIMIILMAILDTIGIASIMPFVAVLSNPDMIYDNKYLFSGYIFFNNFGLVSSKQYIFILGILVFILVIISIIFRALASFIQTRFSLTLEHTIATQLFRNYISQPFSWFFKKNSADLTKNIISEVNLIILYGVTPVINIFAQGTVTFGIVILLVIADTNLALSIGGILGIIYATTYILIGGPLIRIGKQRFINNEARFRVLNEALSATREVKIFNLKENFINRYSGHAKLIAKYQALGDITGLAPRFVLEALLFGGMLSTVLYLMTKSGNLVDALPVISLYAFAGYRLLPAIQSLYLSFAQIKFSTSSLEMISVDLSSLLPKNSNLLEFSNHKIIKFRNEIILDDISFKYPGTKISSVKNISLKIPFRSSIGFKGVTGSGKTTIIDIITGLLSPDTGTLKVDGQVIDDKNLVEWQNLIGYVPQQIYLSDTSLASNIAFGLEEKNIDLNAVEKAARLAKLHNFVINELPDGYMTLIGENGTRLSGGQRQRIAIARALYRQPKVLIFDEATSSLDSETENAVMEAVQSLRKSITLIQISHRISTLKECDTIYSVENGKILFNDS